MVDTGPDPAIRDSVAARRGTWMPRSLPGGVRSSVVVIGLNASVAAILGRSTPVRH